MHIDGASGGFVNPFLFPNYKWDFRLPRVQSINASGHKYGLAPPGLGWVIYREREVFNAELVCYVNYLGGEMPTATLNFSRNSFQVAVQYYQFLRLGFEGYQRIMRRTLDNAIALRKTLFDSEYFTVMNTTQRIPVVAVTLDKKITRFNEFDVSTKVREKGWVLSAYSMPPNAQEVMSLRVVLRPHICPSARRLFLKQGPREGNSTRFSREALHLSPTKMQHLPAFSWDFTNVWFEQLREPSISGSIPDFSLAWRLNPNPANEAFPSIPDSAAMA